MRRALVAPLASGLVMPGLGQLINRQPGKGAALIMGASLLFLITLGLAFYKVSQALIAMGELAPGGDKWAALRAELINQGSGWLLVLFVIFAAIWLYAVIDAFRTGRRLDRAPQPGQG
ncbi:MAG: hypothetical protein PVG03_01035 [Desulfarculaceae bacterium]|jgi:hypothetical protein